MRLDLLGRKISIHIHSALFSPSIGSHYYSAHVTSWTHHNSQVPPLKNKVCIQQLSRHSNICSRVKRHWRQKQYLSIIQLEELEGCEIRKGGSQHLERRWDSVGDNKDEMEQIFKRRLKRESRVRSKLVCPTSLTFFRSVSGLNSSAPFPC